MAVDHLNIWLEAFEKPLMDQLDAIARVDRRLADYISYSGVILKDLMGWEWLNVPERDAFVDRGGGWQVS